MSVVAAASIEIHTCPQDVPSLPAWFAEVTLVARHLTQRGILDSLCDQVHLARGRAGEYEVIDFLAVLFGYALSGEPTLSRFLAAVDEPCVEALRALFEQDYLQHGFSPEQCGG